MINPVHPYICPVINRGATGSCDTGDVGDRRALGVQHDHRFITGDPWRMLPLALLLLPFLPSLPTRRQSRYRHRRDNSLLDGRALVLSEAFGGIPEVLQQMKAGGYLDRIRCAARRTVRVRAASRA